MKANTWGDLARSGRLFDSLVVDFADIALVPFVEAIIPNEQMDGICFQLISGGQRELTILDGDEVVESTSTWTFKAGNFTEADEGGTFVVLGSDEGNDATYTIDTVVNAFTITSVEAPNDDEEFDPDSVTVSVIQNSPLGDWEFFVSNTYCAGNGSDTPNDGKPWTPITSQFQNPAVAPVAEQYVEDEENSANQYIQGSPLTARSVKIRFTPSAGAGPISAFGFSKGNR